jgi:hypothetical protein
VAFVKAMDVFPVEALVPDLHPSAEGSNCRKILNREPDCLSGGGKTTTNGSRTCPTLALCHEQFGWKSVVEGHDLFVLLFGSAARALEASGFENRRKPGGKSATFDVDGAVVSPGDD